MKTKTLRLTDHQTHVLRQLIAQGDQSPSQLGTTWRTVEKLETLGLIELRKSATWTDLVSSPVSDTGPVALQTHTQVPARMPFITEAGREFLRGHRR
jgi:hypothetical protein